MPSAHHSLARTLAFALIALTVLVGVLWHVGLGGARGAVVGHSARTETAAVAADASQLSRAAATYGTQAVSPRAAPQRAAAAPTAVVPVRTAAQPVTDGASRDATRVTGSGRASDGQALVVVASAMAVHRTVGGGRILGVIPARSKYLKTPTVAWVRARSADGRWGLVTVPFERRVRSGWVLLDGAELRPVGVHIDADLSSRRLAVMRGGTTLFTAPMAVGSAGSPSPTGSFWVTDPIAVGPDQPQFGSFAFGISALQPHPPRGWTGGNQMAIHGTNQPGTIGTAASAGCLRVSEETLRQLRPLVTVGTPVVIHA